MTKVLKVDVSGLLMGAFASKALTLPGHWFMSYRWIATQATLANLTASAGGAGDKNTAVPVNLSANVGDGFLGVDFGSTGFWKLEGDFDPSYGAGSAQGHLTGDVWHTVQMEYDGVNIKWSFDGVLLFNYALAPVDADSPIQVGSTFTVAIPGPQVYYIADLKIGSTLGGDDIFAPDFGLHGLSEFDSVTEPGALTIVDDPLGPGPALIRSPSWRFVLTTLDQHVLSFLDYRAINRDINYYLRKAPTAAGRVYAADPEINIVHTDGEPFLAEGVRILIGLRREGGTPPWVPRFAGIILQADRVPDGDTPYVDFTAYGPRQLLYKRPVRDHAGALPPRGGLVFKQQRGSDILLALINRTVAAEGPVFIDTTTGTLEDTDRIDLTVPQMSSVGQALELLEATGTIDILLPAVWDPVGQPGILAQLNIHVQAGTIRRGAIMAYDLPGHSIESYDWLENGDDRANDVQMYTVAGIPVTPVLDVDSIAEFGTYFAQQGFPAQAGISALEAEAAVQLLTRKDHPTTLRITPVPERAPVPFNEYGIADWLPVYASKRTGKQLAGLYRLYEMPVSLLDDAIEQPHDLIVSQNLEPGA